MLTIQNLHKLYGWTLISDDESGRLKFRDDQFVLISDTAYQIEVTYQRSDGLTTDTKILLYRQINEMFVAGESHTFTQYDIQHIHNFVSYIGRIFFPSGFWIRKPKLTS